MPNQIGDGEHLPHITVGVAKFDDLKLIEAGAFDPFGVHPSSVSVYHLGNNGTARAELKSWGPVASQLVMIERSTKRSLRRVPDA